MPSERQKKLKQGHGGTGSLDNLVSVKHLNHMTHNNFHYIL